MIMDSGGEKMNIKGDGGSVQSGRIKKTRGKRKASSKPRIKKYFMGHGDDKGKMFKDKESQHSAEGNKQIKAENNEDATDTRGKRKKERFPGRKPLDPSLQKKYSKGKGIDTKHVRPEKRVIMEKKLLIKETIIKEAEEETARAEVLLTENSGLLQTEEGTYTAHVTQTDLRNAVDITSATKSFDLHLKQFGPYKMQFTRNGRHLLLGGRKGHLAAFDWVTKKLHFEINVMESIHDVCWLSTELMMATAQKQWVHIYDNQGTEIHCVKKMDVIHRLEYLPYHFLLCSGGETGKLSWLDISLGKEMLTVDTKKGRLEVMHQNPYNAVLCCGHSNGVVTMWTPNDKNPVASILCHSHPVRALEFDPAGRFFATSGLNKELKIWDARNLGKSLYRYNLGSGASGLAFSQKQLLAVSVGNVVEVYEQATSGGMNKPYMHYRCDSSVTGMQFCPYEDVLGVSTYTGYSSLLIPGAGEPHFDALESNPYASTRGRSEAEVKSLLAKVPHNLITLDPASVAQVDLPTLEEKLEARRALQYIKVPSVDATPRYRMKGKSGSAQKFNRTRRIKDDKKRAYLKKVLAKQNELGLGKIKKVKKPNKNHGYVLNRFQSKT